MGARRTATSFCPRRTRRNAENTFFDLWSPQEGAHKGRPYGGMRRGCIWHILNGFRQCQRCLILPRWIGDAFGRVRSIRQGGLSYWRSASAGAHPPDLTGNLNVYSVFRFLNVQGRVKRQSGQPTRAERYRNGRRGSRQITGDRITCEFDPVEGRLFLLDIFDQRHIGGGRFLFVRHHHAGAFWIRTRIIETPASPLCAFA